MDYMNFITQLGIKINKSILYPKDLIKEHDKMFQNTEVLENEEYIPDIIYFEKMIRPYNYENESLIIRCARTVEELVNESSVLEHCVRNYIPKVAQHKTSIFFVRKKEDEETPYVTVELDPINKVLLQCRAKRNAVPKNDVMKFIHEWCQSRKIDDSSLTFTV
jgi:hypothetical protein